MKIRRRGTATWDGTVPAGSGSMAGNSGALDVPFSLESRVAETPQSSPEELIGAALPDNVRRFHAALAGPKTLVWMEGEHTEFYDHEPLITCAARAAAGHLRTALGGPST